MQHYSPYLLFPRKIWQTYRHNTPLTLSEADLAKLQGQIEAVSLQEVAEIYLPLSRLLSLYIAQVQQLYRVTQEFLGHPAPKVPYIIGIAGSVAVGKSTTSRILQALLSRWPAHPKVELVTTDGFLYPNAVLEQRGLANRKGFPESFNLPLLIDFLADLKSGKPNLNIPVYSHHAYDILPHQQQPIQPADIVIIEGLNVLQVGAIKAEQKSRVFVSDFFDFTIYVDAKMEVIRQWFLQRFTLFRERATQDPEAFFYQFAQMPEAKALSFAEQVWREINQANLIENILPFRERAKLILVKGEQHAIEKVYLRKI